MRILIFNTNYYPNISGGAELSTQLLAETLAEIGNEVFVCTIADKESQEVVNGVTVIYTHYRNVYWAFVGTRSIIKKILWHTYDIFNISYKRRVKQLICEVCPDIVHTNNICGFSCCVWDVAKSYGIPIVHTLRDYYLICNKSTMFNNDRICKTPCVNCKISTIVPKFMSQNVDAVVGISNYILKKHLDLGYFKRTRIRDVIYNPVDIHRKNNVSSEKSIGFIGSIYKNKGVERLIRDFYRLPTNDYILKIAGSGDENYVGYLKNKYQREDIQFVGRVNAAEFLSSLSLLVVPSEWNEPFGRVVVEAISCGCPVFVSNRGGMPELVTDNVGRVFDVDDPESLYILIDKFVKGNIVLEVNAESALYSKQFIAKTYLETYDKTIKINKTHL